MMPREEWESEEVERTLAAIRERRRALETFSANLPVLAKNVSEDARIQIQPLINRLDDLLGNFNLNDLDEMERLREQIEKLARQ